MEDLKCGTEIEFFIFEDDKMLIYTDNSLSKMTKFYVAGLIEYGKKKATWS